MRLRIREWRKQRGYSQLHLAIRCDCSRETISAIETGRTTPSTPQLTRIAHGLHVHLCELIEGERCPHSTTAADAWRDLC